MGPRAKELGKHSFRALHIRKECNKNLHIWLESLSDTGKFVTHSKCQFVTVNTWHVNASSFYALTLFGYQWSTSCGVMLLLYDSGLAASLLSLIDKDF